MVDATKGMESNYLNVDLVRASPTKKCVILSEGEYVDAQYEGRKYIKFELDIEIDHKQKTWSPNKDTMKNIAEEYGTETEAWIGKLIKLSIGKSNGKDTVIGIPYPMIN